VAKDRNGNYSVQVPTLPPLEDEQVEEEIGGSERDSMFAPIRDGYGGRVGGCWLTGEAELEARMLGLYKEKSLQAGEPGGEG